MLEVVHFNLEWMEYCQNSIKMVQVDFQSSRPLLSFDISYNKVMHFYVYHFNSDILQWYISQQIHLNVYHSYINEMTSNWDKSMWTSFTVAKSTFHFKRFRFKNGTSRCRLLDYSPKHKTGQKTIVVQLNVYYFYWCSLIISACKQGK